ncbi:ribonuclease D [Alphaproteobacteria bacterium]
MFINTNEQLIKHCALAACCQYIAIDTEFICSNRYYYPVLALIQVAYGGDVILIDTLSNVNFTPLAELLTNQNVTKIIHSSRQDMEAIYHKLGVLLSPIFDTQLAALFLGFNEAPSYELIARLYLDVKISKDIQFSNWLVRPLTKRQLDYAVSDVVHLLPIFRKMRSELQECNKLAFLTEECANISKNAKFYPTPAYLLATVANLERADHVYLVACLKILEWREKLACKLNIPRNALLDGKLIPIVVNEFLKLTSQFSDNAKTELSVQDCRKLVLHNGLIKYLSKIRKDIFSKLIAFLLKIPTPRHHEICQIEHIITAFQQKRRLVHVPEYSSLKTLLLVVSAKYRISTTIIANKSDILLLANNMHVSKIMTGWRYDVFGRYAKELLAGEILDKKTPIPEHIF